MRMAILLNRLREISRQHGLNINKNKTRIMIVDRGNIMPLNAKNYGYETVENVVYI